MKDLYVEYLKRKLGFTENVVSSLMHLHDKGGTIPVFPKFGEWKKDFVKVKPDIWWCCGVAHSVDQRCSCGEKSDD